jgi:hypothetical protein
MVKVQMYLVHAIPCQRYSFASRRNLVMTWLSKNKILFPSTSSCCPRDAVSDYIPTHRNQNVYVASIGVSAMTPSAATFPRTNQGPQRKQMFVHHPDMMSTWTWDGEPCSPSVGRRTWPPPRARLCVPEPEPGPSPLARRPPRAHVLEVSAAWLAEPAAVHGGAQGMASGSATTVPLGTPSKTY